MLAFVPYCLKFGLLFGSNVSFGGLLPARNTKYCPQALQYRISLAHRNHALKVLTHCALVNQHMSHHTN